MNKKNITSQQLQTELYNVIEAYINQAKINNKRLTRDEVIVMLTSKLKEIIDSSKNDDQTLLASGIAVGMATVLQIEMILSEDLK